MTLNPVYVSTLPNKIIDIWWPWLALMYGMYVMSFSATFLDLFFHQTNEGRNKPTADSSRQLLSFAGPKHLCEAADSSHFFPSPNYTP